MADLTKEDRQRLVRAELVRREIARRQAQQQPASAASPASAQPVTIGTEEELGSSGWRPVASVEQEAPQRDQPPAPDQRLDEQKAILASADKTNGAPWHLRGAASYKAAGADKLGFLQARLGAENVRPMLDDDGTETGNYLWRKPGDKNWSVFDPKFADAPLADLGADLADWSGDVVMGIPAAAGLALGPAGLPLGGAVGDVARQGVSAMLPGDQPKTIAERGRSAYEGALLNTAGTAAGAAIPPVAGAVAKLPVIKQAAGAAGTAGRWAANVGRNIWEGAKALPSEPEQGLAQIAKAPIAAVSDTMEQNAIEQIAKDQTLAGLDAARKPIMEKTANTVARTTALEGRINARLPDDSPRLRLSLAQKTGSRTALTMDQVARQAGGEAAEVMRFVDLEQQQAIQKFTDKTIESLAKAAPDIEVMSERARVVFDKNLEKLMEARSKVATPIIRQLQVVSRGKKVFDLSNTLKTVDEIVKGKVGGFGPETEQSVAKYVGKIRSDILEAASSKQSTSTVLDYRGNPIVSEIPGEPTAFTAMDMQKSLEKAGHGSKFGDIVVDKLDRSTTQKIWQRIFVGLQKDVDAAVAAGGDAGEQGALLRKFRDAWREGSKAVEEARPLLAEKAFTLGKSESVEQLPTHILQDGTSRQKVRRGFAVLRKADPEAADQLAAAVMQRVVDMAQSTAGGASEAMSYTSPAKLAAGIRKAMPKLSEMGLSREHLADIEDIAAGARLLADRANPGTSSTFTLMTHDGTVQKGVEQGISNVIKKIPIAGETIVAAAGWIERQFMDPARMAVILNSPEQAQIMAKIMNQAPSARPAQISRLIGQFEAISQRDARLLGDGAKPTADNRPPPQNRLASGRPMESDR